MTKVLYDKSRFSKVDSRELHVKSSLLVTMFHIVEIEFFLSEIFKKYMVFQLHVQFR